MAKIIGPWWHTHKDEVDKCLVIVIGSVVWYVGRELMTRQRLPFVSPLPHDVVGNPQSSLLTYGGDVMASDEHDDTQDWKTIVREEVLWLLHTLGIISLSLAIGRLITYLTKGGDIDLSLLHGRLAATSRCCAQTAGGADTSARTTEDKENPK